MANEAGTGRLGTGGWAIVAGIALSAGLVALYALGVIGPRSAEAPEAAVPAPAVDAGKPVAETAEAENPGTSGNQPDTGAQPGQAQQTATGDASSGGDAAETAAAPGETASEPVEQSLSLPVPVLDQIFVERDGSTLISGRAEVGSRIVVLLDGAELYGFEVTGDGNFAEFLTLSFSDAARVLTLRSQRDGQTVLSEDYIIAALPAPESAVVAEAEEAEAGTRPGSAAQAVETAPAKPEPPRATDQVATASEGPAQDQTGAEPQQQDARQSAAATDDPALAQNNSRQAITQQDPADLNETATTEAPQAEPATESSQVAGAAIEGAPQADDPSSAPTASQQEAVAGSSATAEPATGSPAPVAVLRSDASGVELVQAPEVSSSLEPMRVALDTIGYSETGNVRLTGRANGGSVVRVYFDNRVVSDALADAQGKWRGEIEGIVPGVYTLRLDELGEDGAVLSRLETPFKREAPEVLRPADPQSGEAPARPLVHAVTVQKGDTLWAISRERYGEGLLYVKVFDANRDSIRNPDLIYPGQVFNLPD
ncbi:LysM peptidoglycan-binding domain-containing protein [Ruegeria marina]|uniref:Nucleoid-associated protein YgaU, contains BON and LysM domains n=1 Tax=Ruegeria marina TaxID=639004 RepID=A0A1G6QLG8_9RHOB|nr:LysM peptidoglycan-binding domain-containing protein [Ruegeria marina]SDC93209.1 Nucleoid-associated protein YgaU, contains BON and LysM domains [Ruegeria marina]